VGPSHARVLTKKGGDEHYSGKRRRKRKFKVPSSGGRQEVSAQCKTSEGENNRAIHIHRIVGQVGRKEKAKGGRKSMQLKFPRAASICVGREFTNLSPPDRINSSIEREIYGGNEGTACRELKDLFLPRGRREGLQTSQQRLIRSSVRRKNGAGSVEKDGVQAALHQIGKGHHG